MTKLVSKKVIIAIMAVMLSAAMPGLAFGQNADAENERELPKTNLKKYPEKDRIPTTQERPGKDNPEDESTEVNASVSIPSDTFFYIYNKSPLQFAIFKWTREYKDVFLIKDRENKCHEAFVLGEDDTRKMVASTSGVKYAPADGKIGGVVKMTIGNVRVDIDFYTHQLVVEVEKNVIEKTSQKYKVEVNINNNNYVIEDDSGYRDVGTLVHIVDENTGREMVRRAPEKDSKFGQAAVMNGIGDGLINLDNDDSIIRKINAALKKGRDAKERAAKEKSDKRKQKLFTDSIADFLEAYVLLTEDILGYDEYPDRNAEGKRLLGEIELEFRAAQQAPPPQP